jgi:hypothetical protein
MPVQRFPGDFAPEYGNSIKSLTYFHFERQAVTRSISRLPNWVFWLTHWGEKPVRWPLSCVKRFSSKINLVVWL